MTFLRRAHFSLSIGLIFLVVAMFVATMAMAYDTRVPDVATADMTMKSDDGSCPDRPDADCHMACRVFCHGLSIIVPDLPKPVRVEPACYDERVTRHVGFGSEIEDPPPRS